MSQAPEFTTLEADAFSNAVPLAAAGLQDDFFDESRIAEIAQDFVGFEGEDDPNAVVMHYPSEEGGVAILAYAEQEDAEAELAMLNAWPVLPDVLSVGVSPLKVATSEDGLQAFVTARIGNAVLTWFEDAFIVSAPAYREGEIGHAQFYAICSQAAPASNEAIRIAKGEAEYDQLIAAGHRPGADGAIEFRLDGAALIIPRTDIGANVFEFRGPLVSLDPLEDWVVPGAYVARITVMRPFDDEQDEPSAEGFDLPVLIRPEVVDGAMPKPGEDIQGLLYLFGTGFETAFGAEGGEISEPFA